MSTFPPALITLLFGVAGGLLARRIRLPGGPILGAMLAAGAAHVVLEGLDPLGPAFRIGAQLLIGAVIGTSLTRSPLRALRELGFAVVVVLGVLIVAALAAGFALAAGSGLPLTTALFSTAPGSASDMAAAALQFDADVPLIAAFHAVRQIAVFGIVVALFSRAFRSAERPAPN